MQYLNSKPDKASLFYDYILTFSELHNIRVIV